MQTDRAYFSPESSVAQSMFWVLREPSDRRIDRRMEEQNNTRQIKVVTVTENNITQERKKENSQISPKGRVLQSAKILFKQINRCLLLDN